MALQLGIVASSAVGFVATGGTIIDAGGYRHHIFESSGTFSVLSGEKTVYAFTQDGGSNGGNWYGTYNGSNFDYYAGSGGNAGIGYYTSLGFIATPGDRSVVVGSSGSQTTVSGAAFDVTTGSKSGGQGGFAGSYANYYCDEWGCYLYWSSYLNNGASGQSSTSNNIVALNPTLYTALSAVRPNMTTGGGGGGGAIQNYSTGVYRAPASGGSFGGTTGATNSANASNAAANTGAGGGGGFLGVTFNSGNGSYQPQASYNAGSGGSGYAILSYSLA